MKTESSVALSLILPAYNEAERLPPYLESVRRYFESTFARRYEVVVVDDGSMDELPRVLEMAGADWPELTVVRHPSNRGKGAAVRSGVAVARGELLLFADADGAASIEEERALRAAVADGADIAVGSRLLGLEVPSRSRRRWYRDLAGRCFAEVVRRLIPLPVRDTQCGFKLFRREAGLALFRQCRECGYLIDVELLILAKEWGFRVAEVPVQWRDVPGSKVRLVRDGWKMLIGTLRLQQKVRSDGNRLARGEVIEHSERGRPSSVHSRV